MGKITRLCTNFRLGQTPDGYGRYINNAEWDEYAVGQAWGKGKIVSIDSIDGGYSIFKVIVEWPSNDPLFLSEYDYFIVRDPYQIYVKK
jgi:hypothetical protein